MAFRGWRISPSLSVLHQLIAHSATAPKTNSNTKLPKMNLGIYAVVAITTMFATAINAQPLCPAQGCAYLYSQSNFETSQCCQKQNMDFNECCKASCIPMLR
ncbi:PcF and SCR74-like cys-rich secreted peptide, putative [Phytophthora infestans T30-4]|uniref:PcF and SCR74-like cys-rich secreted peptide, putative n=1 Tax=Phytophthora infestans (strain T30-4) TaxID=403677 RepID=D0NEI9_PHYIT|nr:PcF and SCR74-like cys-rich secreted peptide, putative [Phytophthora infestans T30-4]EEY56634.1 PcF and SCR74-like cys-rich secreted peptide, putative [Phytophthora infestans T30-4]|eukprot:XP_002902708.1 PcF and SCR74-like cys-rich secreted peptide, putative [Phytophthora infestans T30-4]